MSTEIIDSTIVIGLDSVFDTKIYNHIYDINYILVKFIRFTDLFK